MDAGRRRRQLEPAREALALWRGSAAGRRRRRAVRRRRRSGRLDELRLRAPGARRSRPTWPRAGIDAGAAPSSTGLVAEHPLRERRARACWMLALLPLRAARPRRSTAYRARASELVERDRRRARTRAAAPARGGSCGRTRRSAGAAVRAARSARRDRDARAAGRARTLGRRRARRRGGAWRSVAVGIVVLAERRRGAAARPRTRVGADRPRAGRSAQVYPVGRQPAAVAAGARSRCGSPTRWMARVTRVDRDRDQLDDDRRRRRSRPRSPSAQAQSGSPTSVGRHAEPGRAGVEPGGAALPARRRCRRGSRSAPAPCRGRDAAGGRDRAGRA